MSEIAEDSTASTPPPPDPALASRALDGFIREYGRLAAGYLEACVHCGMCAEACHFHEVTQEAIYTPIWKVTPFRRAYFREYGPFAPVYRMLGLRGRPKPAELASWQHLLFEACTLCGRCSVVCPMGIDIAGLIAQTREGMAEAGLVPQELLDLADNEVRTGLSTGLPSDEVTQILARIAAEHGTTVFVDLPQADVVCTLASADIESYPASIAALAKIMNHLGLRWTYLSAAFEASHYGVVAGDRAAQTAVTMRLLDAVRACGAHSLVLPECGHAYGALRWEGANIAGKKLPFAVLHASEFVADRIADGTLLLSPVTGTVTFHDPCQVARRGGVTEAPRVILKALGAELRELVPGQGTNWCCGGGGGVQKLPATAGLRHKVYELKLRQFEDAEATTVLTSCSGCRQAFDTGRAQLHSPISLDSLLELVADHLAGNAP